MLSGQAGELSILNQGELELGFKIEQLPLSVSAKCVAGQGTVSLDHPVAGNNKSNRF